MNDHTAAVEDAARIIAAVSRKHGRALAEFRDDAPLPKHYAIARALAAAGLLAAARPDTTEDAEYEAAVLEPTKPPAVPSDNTTTEWGVRHSQGIRKETSERAAREFAAAHEAGDQRRRPEARGKTRVVRREVTAWTEAE